MMLMRIYFEDWGSVSGKPDLKIKFMRALTICLSLCWLTARSCGNVCQAKILFHYSFIRSLYSCCKRTYTFTHTVQAMKRWWLFNIENEFSTSFCRCIILRRSSRSSIPGATFISISYIYIHSLLCLFNQYNLHIIILSSSTSGSSCEFLPSILFFRLCFLIS